MNREHELAAEELLGEVAGSSFCIVPSRVRRTPTVPFDLVRIPGTPDRIQPKPGTHRRRRLDDELQEERRAPRQAPPTEEDDSLLSAIVAGFGVVFVLGWAVTAFALLVRLVEWISRGVLRAW